MVWWIKYLKYLKIHFPILKQTCKMSIEIKIKETGCVSCFKSSRFSKKISEICNNEVKYPILQKFSILFLRLKNDKKKDKNQSHHHLHILFQIHYSLVQILISSIFFYHSPSFRLPPLPHLLNHLFVVVVFVLIF